MTEKNQVYRCSVCGNIVEVKHGAMGELVCCSKSMNLLVANTEDAAVEKHVPIVSLENNKIQVKIGEIAHPMTEEHYIEWITLVSEDTIQTVYLKPGDAPEAVFEDTCDGGVVYEYCNLHGLWKKEL